jgi:hypothetical protein
MRGVNRLKDKPNKIDVFIIQAGNNYIYFPKIDDWATPMHQQRTLRNTKITVSELILDEIRFDKRNEIIIDRIWINGEEYEETLKRLRIFMENYRKIRKCLKDWDFKDELPILHYLGKKLNRYLKKIVEIYKKENLPQDADIKDLSRYKSMSVDFNPKMLMLRFIHHLEHLKERVSKDTRWKRYFIQYSDFWNAQLELFEKEDSD